MYVLYEEPSTPTVQFFARLKTITAWQLFGAAFISGSRPIQTLDTVVKDCIVEMPYALFAPTRVGVAPLPMRAPLLVTLDK